jgi:hypothetical protein
MKALIKNPGSSPFVMVKPIGFRESCPLASPSPLKGERAGVRGEKPCRRSIPNEIRRETSHPSPLIHLPVEGRGKRLGSISLATEVIELFDPLKTSKKQIENPQFVFRSSNGGFLSSFKPEVSDSQLAVVRIDDSALGARCGRMRPS